MKQSEKIMKTKPGAFSALCLHTGNSDASVCARLRGHYGAAQKLDVQAQHLWE
jgi:hypothetical protein